MQELDLLLVGALLSRGITYAFVLFDRMRLTTAQRERSWNEATTGAAILVFSSLCIVAHFWVTRRSARGLAAGVFALVLLLLAQGGLTMLYQQVGLLALAAILLYLPVAFTLVPFVVLLHLLGVG